jgi:hypothetical protein
MVDGQPTWETTSTDSGSDEDSSSEESDENDIGVASAIPRLFIRTPSLVGPAHLVPLTDEIHRLLTVEQNMFSVFLQACRRDGAEQQETSALEFLIIYPVLSWSVLLPKKEL